MITKLIGTDPLVGYDDIGNFRVGRREGGSTTYIFVDPQIVGRTCYICQRQFEATSESLYDSTEWYLVNYDPVHRSCLARYQSLVQRNTVIFTLANEKIRHNGLVMIPNGYWGPNDEWGKWQPWYQADLTDHQFRFTIGRRKRVWEIVLEPTGPREPTGSQDIPNIVLQSAESAFENEHVTKGFSPTKILVHAWGDEHLARYIGILATKLGLRR